MQNVSPGPESHAPFPTGTGTSTLADLLDRHTARGSLWHAEGEGRRIRCVACGHRCLIGLGRRGICRVRFNRDGELRVPFGYVAGLQSDPVEKKPFYHLYPGTDALTFGMLGCDFHCSYCQNWVTSQALRDLASAGPVQAVTPEQIAAAARKLGSRLVVSSYNEPLITAEWAAAVFEQANQAGFACAFVSNGNATAEVLDFLRPLLVGFKIDLKGFNPARYRSLGGTLDRVTEAIRMIHARGLWLEIVTLLVPGFNDSVSEIRDLARFLVSVSPDIPWHVTAFHPDYKMPDPPATTAQQIVQAAEIGTQEGLRFVYAGNAPGRVGRWENTWCPRCGELLIERFGFMVRGYHLTAAGQCPKCSSQVPGVWGKPSETPTFAGVFPRFPRLVRL